MPGFKSILGRHKADYASLKVRPNPDKAEIVELEDYAIDIANAEFPRRKLVINCWPDSLNRRWGQYHGKEACIMHFKIQADHERDLKLVNFELSIVFEAVDTPGAASQTDTIALIDTPSPDSINASNGTDRHQLSNKASWSFSSRTIGSPSAGAKWIWEADVCEKPMLYGGIAMLHPGKPLIGRCHVKGLATKSLIKSTRRFRFDNAHHDPKQFRVIPQKVDQCIKTHIISLNTEVKARFASNTLVSQLQTPLSQPARSNVDDVQVPSAEHRYQSGEIGGYARVHLGASYTTNYNMIPRTQENLEQPVMRDLSARSANESLGEPRAIPS